MATALAGSIWYISTRNSTPPSQIARQVDVGVPGLPNDADDLFHNKSSLLYDFENDRIAFAQNGFERVPIASITKLMTAMVALDAGIDWDQEANIEPNEYVAGGQLLLHPGETVTMRDLFTTSLMSSANNATLAYVRQLNIPKDEFIRRMNRKAIELELEQTRFFEVTGLSKENVSTAYEVALLAAAALQYQEILAATSGYEYGFKINGSGREHTIYNSNKVFSETSQKPFLASKTGYIYEAGYCLVVRGSGENQNLIAVILGSPSEELLIADIQRLLNLPIT